ncbi:MAG: hypothetical protein AAFW89_12650 [Bacteroidota bacterium]
MIKAYSGLLISLIFIAGCETQPTIDGLWVITSVSLGRTEMTPNARWIRFNSDFTQESGNGWFQHSEGTWNLDASTNKLSMVNTNGVDDPYEAFTTSFTDNGNMIWTRTEGRNPVRVILERRDELPSTVGDRLLGVWSLEEAVGEGGYFTGDSTSGNEYIFFRWDKRFEIGTGDTKIYGVYNLHGHKPEVELIPYDDKYPRNFWRVQAEKDTILLGQLNTLEPVVRKFKRIRELPR